MAACKRPDAPIRETGRMALLQHASQVAGTEEEANRAMEDVMKDCAEKNPAAGISGFLAFDEENLEVLQTLEGPPEIVQRLWQLIQQDVRHHSARIIHSCETKTRAFGCFRALDGPPPASLEQLTYATVKASVKPLIGAMGHGDHQRLVNMILAAGQPRLSLDAA